MKQLLRVRPLCLLVLIFSLQALAQSIRSSSEADQGLTLKTLALAPLVDNVSGIYSKPLDETLKETVLSTHRWEIVDTTKTDKSVQSTPEQFENSPAAVKDAFKKSDADGLISGRISRGPKGVSIKITLYAGAEGLPVGSEDLNNYSGFNINDLKVQLEALTKRLLAKLPYHAVVMSRKGQLVTLNIGTSSGVHPGMEATAIQLIKIHRHPKFNFIVSTDTLTLGKIQINKVDDYLSFGTITTERDAGVIVVGTKVSFGNFVQYPSSDVTAGTGSENDNSLAYGNKPKEWVPATPPTFGKVGILLGLGNYTISNSLTTGGVTGSAPIIPSIHLSGELWFNPNWSLNANISDYIASVSNGLANSTPSSLNASISKTALSGNYSFLMSDDFFGPKVSVGLGYALISTFIDNSNPTAFESTAYSGTFLRVGGSFPFSSEGIQYPFRLGGHLDYFLNASVTEAPTTSGSSSSQVSTFAVTGEKLLTERINLHGEIMFDSLISNFSGTGSRTVPSSSGSQTLTTFGFGVEYLF
jgi:hypothetical protein